MDLRNPNIDSLAAQGYINILEGFHGVAGGDVVLMVKTVGNVARGPRARVRGIRARAIIALMSKVAADAKIVRRNPSARAGLSPLLDPKARLAAWEQARGMWKNRKPDPIKELVKMRKEWERKLPWPKSAKRK